MNGCPSLTPVMTPQGPPRSGEGGKFWGLLAEMGLFQASFPTPGARPEWLLFPAPIVGPVLCWTPQSIISLHFFLNPVGQTLPHFTDEKNSRLEEPDCP